MPAMPCAFGRECLRRRTDAVVADRQHDVLVGELERICTSFARACLERGDESGGQRNDDRELPPLERQHRRAPLRDIYADPRTVV
jgi:hypothetical protein